MTYTLPEKLAVLEFEEYPGLEVTVRLSPVPMAEYFAILNDLDDPGEGGWVALVQRFAPVGLVSWNLAEPADAAGLVAQPYELAIGIVLQWTKAVADVPVPLPKASSSTTSSEDANPPS